MANGNGEEESGKKARQPPTLGERAFSWCKALAVLVSAVIACYAAFVKGEPVADKTWETLRAQVNKQSDVINKLHLRIVAFQAREETQTAMSIQHKLDDLQKRYDALALTKKPTAAAVAAAAPIPTRVAARPAPPPAPPPVKCRKGMVEAGGRCRWVAPAVLAKIEAEKERRAEAEKKLKTEATLRSKLEKRELARSQMQEQAPTLDPLPKGLDDAAKGK